MSVVPGRGAVSGVPGRGVGPSGRGTDLPRRPGWRGLLPRRGAEGILFLVAVAALVVANVAVIVSSLVQARLWEDEAFNLTVPLNLLAGLGYTSDGTLSGSTLTPFDARISTGPVVLLPVAAVIGLGADPVFGGRAIGLVFWLALVAGCWVIGHGVAGPWAALIAAATPLAINVNQLPSPVQGPTDILGEIPAAALIVWAVIAARRRPWLGGLLLGFAVQAKFIAWLAVPALVVLVFFAVREQPFWQRVRRVLPAAGLALLPSVAYELWKLIALGPAGYVESTRLWVRFVRTGGQSGVVVDRWGKVEAFLAAWFVPWGAALVVGLVVVAGVALAIARCRREVALLGVVGLVGIGTYVGWWLVSGNTPVWIRHPSPGMFAFAPILAAIGWAGWFALARRGAVDAGAGVDIGGGAAAGAGVDVGGGALGGVGDGAGAGADAGVGAPAAASGPARVVRAGAWAALAVIAAGVGGSAVTHAVVGVPSPVTLAQQRAVAEQIAAVPAVAESDWLIVQWGAAVSLAVLADKHVGMVDAGPGVHGFPMIWPGEPFPCDEAGLAPPYRICAPGSLG